MRQQVLISVASIYASTIVVRAMPMTNQLTTTFTPQLASFLGVSHITTDPVQYYKSLDGIAKYGLFQKAHKTLDPAGVMLCLAAEPYDAAKFAQQAVEQGDVKLLDMITANYAEYLKEFDCRSTRSMLLNSAVRNGDLDVIEHLLSVDFPRIGAHHSPVVWDQEGDDDEALDSDNENDSEYEDAEKDNYEGEVGEYDDGDDGVDVSQGDGQQEELVEQFAGTAIESDNYNEGNDYDDRYDEDLDRFEARQGEPQSFEPLSDMVDSGKPTIDEIEDAICIAQEEHAEPLASEIIELLKEYE